MSHIDLFKHKEVGQVVGIPVYQALQDIDSDEISCKRNQLIIGGGGGEHSAAVVIDVSSCVSTYIFWHDDNYDPDDKYLRDFDNIDYSKWDIADIVALDKACRNVGFSSKNNIDYIELFMVCEIAKLVLEVCPELVDNSLIEHYNNNKSKN